MKYVKQFLKGGIFLVVCTMIFGFSNNTVSAEPKTADECLTYVTKTAQCKSSCEGLTQIGTCSDRTDGTTLCCDRVYKEGDRCGTNDKGTCREYKGAGKTCTGDETDVGVCAGGTTATLTCCMSPDSVPTSDDSCNKAGGVCINDSGAADGGCSQNGKSMGTKIGTCDKKAGTNDPQNCCKNSTSTPSNSGSGSSAALNYTPLENLPGFENLESREIEGCGSNMFCKYFKALYLLALWIVGISALFMLVVGGFLYLSSAGNTSLVGTAKKTIYGALIGLVIALISWLLLDTINSDLTNLKLSRLSGAVGTGGGGNNGGSGSSGGGSVPDEYKGKGSGCNGIPTQPGIDKQCGDASQNLSDTLKCIADKVGTNNIELSSISDSAGFSKCQNEYNKPPCHHTENSCHYGGHNKNPKSCAADISTKGSSASDSSIVDAAKNKCNAPTAKNEGNHIHVSVSGCSCDYHN